MAFTLDVISDFGRPATRRPNAMFSNAVMVGNKA